MINNIFITGAGVSNDSGIPTFRGNDGFWTIGSVNYTPQEMATRKMYCENPSEFLLWYYKRFASYRHVQPNETHFWLSDKNLITQNIDGLDGKAGNKEYIPIHGRLDKVTVFQDQEELVPLNDAPWDIISKSDIFIMPSVIYKNSVEGFGIVFIEAAQHGVTSIGGRDGGAADAIVHEKTGLICDGNSLENIYDSIINLLANKKYKEFGIAAKENSKNFLWSNIIEKYKRIL